MDGVRLPNDWGFTDLVTHSEHAGLVMIMRFVLLWMNTSTYMMHRDTMQSESQSKIEVKKKKRRCRTDEITKYIEVLYWSLPSLADGVKHNLGESPCLRHMISAKNRRMSRIKA